MLTDPVGNAQGRSERAAERRGRSPAGHQELFTGGLGDPPLASWLVVERETPTVMRWVLAALVAAVLAVPAQADYNDDDSESSWQTRGTPFALGRGAVESGDYQRALELFAAVVATDPDNADAWNLIGYSHRKLGAFASSLAAYRKAPALDPDHRGANEYLGELHLKMGDLPAARQRLAKLESLCGAGCTERDHLAKAIAAYEARTGTSR